MTKKNQLGIGLIESLLAVGIVGALALIINQFSRNAYKAVNNLELNDDIKVTLQQIQAVLSDTDSCTTTFVGRSASNASNVVQTLKKKNATGYGDAFKTKTLSPTISYGQKLLKINSYSLSDAAAEVDVATMGTTQLIVNFDRGKKNAQTESISKKINLRVVVNGSGNITSCVAFDAITSDIWKIAANNSDIYFNTGNVAIGVNPPIANLTVKATTFPLQPGILILGNESLTAGWHRAAVSLNDSSSSENWRVAAFGASSLEGEGKFGFNHNGISRFILTKNGNVGIGTTRPNCEVTSCENDDSGAKFLHIHSTGTGLADSGSIHLSSDAIGVNKIVGALSFGSLARGGNDKRVSGITGHTMSAAGAPLAGRMLFWTNDGSGLQFKSFLTETGDLWAAGNFTTVNATERSDRRLKKNIKSVDKNLDKLTRLQGVSYQWKNKEFLGKQMGLIAQDVEKIFPEAVTIGENGYKVLSYSSLMAPILNSLEELRLKFLDENKKLKKLKSKNMALKKVLCSKDSSAPFCSEVGHEQ